MESRLKPEVRHVREAFRVLTESDEESECIKFCARYAEVIHFAYTVGDARSGEDVLEDLEEVPVAGLPERVPFGLRKFEDKLMPVSVRLIQRMDDGDISQLALSFGSRSVGGGGSMWGRA